jgi:hypothetical protein
LVADRFQKDGIGNPHREKSDQQHQPQEPSSEYSAVCGAAEEIGDQAAHGQRISSNNSRLLPAVKCP